MKIAVLLTRHRRLLALCGLSACAHLLVLELLAQRGGAPASAPPPGEALRLRLAPAPAAEPVAAASPVAPTRAPQPAQQAGTADRADAVPPPPSLVAAPAPSAAAPASMPAAPPAAAAAPAPEGVPLMQMPSRYRVRMPEPARLSYALARQGPGAAPQAAGSASLDWRTDGERYALSLDGVLGVLRSEGGSSDAGIAPHFAQNEPDAVGAQDRASVLMQLAGIGLAEPDQIRGQVQNEIRIVVAGADGAAIARYQVMGQEQLQTALGGMAAWRLAQVVPAGQERIEVWLAPEHGWLPVQIRLVRADGSAATQTLTRIEPGAPR